MKLTVRLDSYALCGSGEGSGLIDSDIVHDVHGVPYLPGRRLKGLLRESALEVTEMLNMGPGLMEHVFGTEGFQQGTLRMPNLYPEGYEDWAEILPVLIEARDNKLITPSVFLSSFCAIRQQTAIDEKGVAKDASLRISRMLKPGTTFSCGPGLTDGDRASRALLWLSARNLRRFGTRRNRGQGTINCNLSHQEAWTVPDAIAAAASWNAPAAPTTGPAANWKPTNGNGRARLQISIRTRSPIVLAEQAGDLNTVNTASAIPGSTVKGVFVDRVRQALGLQRGKEHESDLFRRFFLEQGEDAVHASPAFPVIGGDLFTPAPLHMHKAKDVPEICNLLESNPPRTRPIRGFIKVRESAGSEAPQIWMEEPETTLFFHHQRSRDRKQGKSSEMDGAIFYYEALEKDQEFRAVVEGPRELAELALSGGAAFSSSIGRSRSAQYGLVDIVIARSEAGEDEEDEELLDDNTTLLTCRSPLIVRNRFGFAEPSAENLEICLKTAISANRQSVDVKVSSPHARTTVVEPYVGVLGCRLPACDAFREGSSFKVEVSGIEETELAESLKKISSEGLGELCAFGYGSVAFSMPPSEDRFTMGFSLPPQGDLPDKTGIPATFKEILKGIIHVEEETFVSEMGIKDAKEYKTGLRLQNHQIGRLEAFIQQAADLASLQAILEALKKPARSKLTAFRTRDNVSLWEKLMDFTEPVAKHIERFRDDHHKIIDLGQAPALTEADRFELARVYWLALLRRLRKINKEQETQP